MAIRRQMRASLFAASALVVVTISPSNAADNGSRSQSGDFCADLKAVVASAFENFASVRGERWREQEFPETYVRPLPLSGARPLFAEGAACTVTIHSKVEGGAGYGCIFSLADFPSPPSADSSFGLAQRVADCFGVNVPAVEFGDAMWGRHRFLLHGTRVTVGEERGPHAERWLYVGISPVK